MTQITYRNLQVNEAQKFWDMMNVLDCETKFMMYEPGEREKVAADIRPIEELIEQTISGKSFLLVAEVDGEIVGYISAERGMQNRIRHTAYIVTGIRQEYRGLGIGKTFFKQLDIWAKVSGITRLELTVMCCNTIAKQLYEKSGFVVEGIKKNAMYVDGEYIDEYYMAKIM